MLCFESPNHKIKNAADSVRNQDAKVITPYSEAADHLLIAKSRILAVCEGIPAGKYPDSEHPNGIPPDPKLIHIVKCLSSAADDQSVCIAQELFYSKR